MATNWYAYSDAAGTKYGIALNDVQQAMYVALGLTLPTAYATLAALQSAIPAAVPYPAGLQSRFVNITSPFFGTAELVILTVADFALIYPTGPTPLPKPAFAYTDAPQITGAADEQRLSN
jgi:hypothetical protein